MNLMEGVESDGRTDEGRTDEGRTIDENIHEVQLPRCGGDQETRKDGVEHRRGPRMRVGFKRTRIQNKVVLP